MNKPTNSEIASYIVGDLTDERQREIKDLAQKDLELAAKIKVLGLFAGDDSEFLDEAFVSTTEPTEPHTPARVFSTWSKYVAVGSTIVAAIVVVAAFIYLSGLSDRSVNQIALVIDCQLPFAKILLLRDGKVFKELDLHHGENKTNLPPGTYTIEASSDANRIQFDKVEIEIDKDPVIVKATRKRFIPGPVPDPMLIPGFREWQVMTIGPRGAVADLQWDAKGEFLACASSDNLVRVFDARSLQLRGAYPGGPAISLGVDGTWLAVADGNSVRTWDLRSGRPGRVFQQHTSKVRFLRWTQEGTLISVDADTAYEWNPETGVSQRKVTLDATIENLTWSNYDYEFAVIDNKGRLLLWDFDTDERTILRHDAKSARVCISPDGKWIATYFGIQSHPFVRVWDSDGKLFRELSDTALTKGISTAVFSNDGKRLFAAEESDSEIFVWDVESGDLLEKYSRSTETTKVVLSPDDKYLAAGNKSGTVYLVNAADSRQVADIQGQVWSRPLNSAFDPNGTSIALGNYVWSSDGYPLHKIRSDGPRKWSPNGELLAVLPALDFPMPAGTLEILHPDGSRLASILKFDSRYAMVDWSPNSRQLVLLSFQKARLWDINERRTVSNLDELKELPGATAPVSWSPDGSQIATGTAEAGVAIWDAKMLRQIGSKLSGSESFIGASQIAWCGEGKIAACSHNEVRVWDVKSGIALLQERVGDYAYNLHAKLKCSDNGEWLAVINGAGNSLFVWNLTSWQVRRVDVESPIKDFAWRSGGGSLAVTQENSIRVWEVRGGETDVELETIGEFVLDGKVQTIVWQPNESIILATTDIATTISLDPRTGRQAWVAIRLGSGEFAAFSSDGQIRSDDSSLQEQFVYLIQADSGELRLLTPSEFSRIAGNESNR